MCIRATNDQVIKAAATVLGDDYAGATPFRPPCSIR